jgi:serine protease Do
MTERTTIRIGSLMATLMLCLVPQLLHGKADNVADVVQEHGKAVVNIRTEEIPKQGTVGRSGFFNTWSLPQIGEDDSEAEENEGSGVVLDAKGIIVTNEHLISKASSIKVTFTNREEYEARVLAADPELDIALLKVDNGNPFPFLKARNTNIRVGEKTIVIGNPYGLSSSVTTGVVSAFRKNVEINSRTYPNLIQTDAAINPGNSGGALLDGQGNLLGIVTAVYEEARGIGFAIPIDEVMQMVSEFLVRAGKRPILGAFIEIVEGEDRSYLLVNRTIPGSPAERSGIRKGDRIIELDNKKIREGIKLQNAFRRAMFSGSNQLRVQRNRLTFVVGIPENALDYLPSPLDQSLCGLRLSDIKGYPKMKYKLKDKSGVVVTKVYKGGIGERFGLRAGDVILSINNADVVNKNSFQVLMVEGLRRNYILYQVKRNEQVFFLPIKLDTLL